MNDMVCPHCRGNVPHGAKVCRGCKAEIDYGAPGGLFLVLAVICVVVGYKTYAAVPDSLWYLGWVVGIASFMGGSALLEKIFSKRVKFKRDYRI